MMYPCLVGVFSTEVGTLDGAREAMGKDEIDAWLWEKFTTKHLVDNGESWPMMVCVFGGGFTKIFQVGRGFRICM